MTDERARGMRSNRPWVLIVDDDLALAAHLGDLFRVEGFGVTMALDGREALQLIGAGTVPDLLVLDMHLAEVNGWDVGAELTRRALQIPIVVITADPDPAACAAAVGAFAYLTKPFELPELRAIIDQLPPWGQPSGVRLQPSSDTASDTASDVMTTELRSREPGRFILVVDDDLAFTTPLAGFLEDEGFRVQVVNTGLEALQAIAKERPELVLLDMYLPEMDGWAFARELKARGVTLPIIVTTAAAQARQAAAEIGAAAYVPKPLSLPMLVRRISEVCA